MALPKSAVKPCKTKDFFDSNRYNLEFNGEEFL